MPLPQNADSFSSFLLDLFLASGGGFPLYPEFLQYDTTIFFFFKRFLCDHLGLYYILHIQLRDDDDGDEAKGQGGRWGEGFRESVAVSP